MAAVPPCSHPGSAASESVATAVSFRLLPARRCEEAWPLWGLWKAAVSRWASTQAHTSGADRQRGASQGTAGSSPVARRYIRSGTLMPVPQDKEQAGFASSLADTTPPPVGQRQVSWCSLGKATLLLCYLDYSVTQGDTTNSGRHGNSRGACDRQPQAAFPDCHSQSLFRAGRGHGSCPRVTWPAPRACPLRLQQD